MNINFDNIKYISQLFGMYIHNIILSLSNMLSIFNVLITQIIIKTCIRKNIYAPAIPACEVPSDFDIPTY